MAACRWVFACAIAASTALSGCGGGDSGESLAPPAPAPAPVPPPPPPVAALPPPIGDAPTRISSASPFTAGCTGLATTDVVYANAEVEPHVAVNPRDPNNWVASWQQDRRSGGAANGLVTATTVDGGITWTRVALPFSRCAGGTPANGGDYDRVTDPWVTFAPDGTVYQMALAVSGASFTAGALSAMLVSRSTDGGRSWGPVSTLIRDGAQFFNDKNTITADPTEPGHVYAVWDRLTATGGGPAMFARTTDGGSTWEAARAIFDPGASSQTIGNVITVLPNGLVVNFFTRLDPGPNGQLIASLHVLVSADKGGSWTGPFKVADLLAVGARDPVSGTPIRDGSTLGQIAVAPNGHLWAVWQDARFSGGTIDGIAIARSTNGGSTWSAPVRVNQASGAQAFTPTVHVTANGTIGVLYYDLRGNDASTPALETHLVLARSTDGVGWTEHRITSAFDLTTAPFAGGYFLGDYQGLASANNVFIPVYVRTNSGDTANRTDVFAVATASLPGVVSSGASARALRGPSVMREPDAEFRRAVHENIVRAMDERLPGWSARLGRPAR